MGASDDTNARADGTAVDCKGSGEDSCEWMVPVVGVVVGLGGWMRR